MKPNDATNVEDFANQFMSGAFVLRGPYGKMARILNDLECNLPSDVRIVYRRVHPGRLIVTLAKGDE